MTPAAQGAPAFPRGTTTTREFPGRADQVPRARRFVAGALGACPARADAVLLASELVTNAVTHSASQREGTFVIAVTHRHGAVRLEVTDRGGRWLGVPAVSPDSEAGRGLIIVSALARAWGVVGDDAGRVVWAELGCR